MNIARLRLHSQQIAAPQFKRPDQVVSSLAAVQAQDYPGALWSIGLRLAQVTERDVVQAIADRTIVRTWSLRGTLHFVAAADVHWMRALVAQRLIASSARRHRELELTTAGFTRCEKVFLKALRGGKQLPREEMLHLLQRAGISAEGQRGYHILWYLAQQGLLCFGVHQEKQPTFALLDEWCPATKPRDREESLAELARRYFTSHGPATAADFVAWSGLPAGEAKLGMNLISAELSEETVGETKYWFGRAGPAPTKESSSAHLLPGFDEYMLGYRDRSPALAAEYASRICPGSNGMFISTVVLKGQVAGTWKRAWTKRTVAITTTPFTSFGPTARKAIAIAAARYGLFVGREVSAVEEQLPPSPSA